MILGKRKDDASWEVIHRDSMAALPRPEGAWSTLLVVEGRKVTEYVIEPVSWTPVTTR